MSFAEAFAAGRAGNRSLLLPYLMSGLPDAEGSVSLFQACADGGADGFEIGIPYTDPLMDGPVIQEAGSRALAAGMTLEGGLRIVEQVATATGLPCAVMTYINPVMSMGASALARAVADAGGSALIVADLPVDESEVLRRACADAAIGLVQFAAPTTTDTRLDRVVAAEPPFVYGIAEMGVTGERRDVSSHAGALVERLKSRTDVPVVLGVGISTPAAAKSAAAIADGVIVGSALVRRVLEAEDLASAHRSLEDAVTSLRASMGR